MGSRVEIFVVNAVGKPVISEVPKEKKTLEELGIVDQTSVVIFDIDVSPDKVFNKTELYHIIGTQFNIEKHLYEEFLPAPEANIDAAEFFDASPDKSLPFGPSKPSGSYSQPR